MVESPQNLRILYAEDNLVDADLARRAMARLVPGYQLTVVDSLAEAQELLAEAAPNSLYDVILADILLPDGNGLELLAMIRDRQLPTAVVILTGSGSKETAIAALKAGADDYLLKDEDYLERLPAILASALAHFRENEARYHRNMRVLYLDPEAANRQAVAAHLTRHAPHISLETAADCAELATRLERYRQEKQPCDLLLLGFPLPACDALEIVKSVRDDRDLDLPVVLIADQGSEQEVAKALRLGVADFIIRHPGYLYGLPAGLGQVMRLRQLLAEQKALKASEQRFRQMEEKFRVIFEGAQDGILLADPENRKFILGNPAICLMLGYTPSVITNLGVDDIHPPTELPRIIQSFERSVRGEEPLARDIPVLRRDGTVFFADISTSPVNLDGKYYLMGIFRDISERKHYEEQLRHMAHHDHLTGLPNRLLLEARLEHGLERAKREEKRLAVLVLNLDRFRTINESLGYAVGDELLVAIIKRLRECLRAEDTLARLAGDEFALVMEALNDYQEAELMARRLREALAQPFTLPGHHQAYIQVTIGISLYPQDGDSATALLAGADVAVNQGKAAGGNQFYYATSTFNIQARRNLELESALRQGLQQEEFLLYYQPKITLRNGRMAGAEALIRWQRPGLGLVPPLVFIPVAERSDLIVAIGAWVIQEACRQLRAWHDQGLHDIHLAVNVSARQFHCQGLVEVLEQALAEHRVPAHHLILELTESMLMLNPEQAIAKMETLRKIGVKLSLDDFGTGYSSFSSLSRFPIEQLKIDRSFIKEVVDNPDAATIAGSIIAMAHRMRLQVVAEGVENEAQCGYLRRHGCDQIQGFLFSRPLPADEFTTMLRQGKSMTIPDEAEEQQQTLLLVDDEPNVLATLKRLMYDEGYRVLTAENAHQALELLATNQVQVIISDQRMPEMSGIEFLSRVKDIYPDTVRMVLSGYADLATVVEAVNEGALYKFLTKPWKNELLLEHVRDAFLYYEAIIKPRYAGQPEETP